LSFKKGGKPTDTIQTTKDEEEGQEREQEQEGEQEVQEGHEIVVPTPKLDESKLARLKAIKDRLAEAKKANNQAVKEEERKMNDPNYEKAMKAKNWNEKKAEIQEENKFKGIDEGKEYLNTTAVKMDHLNGTKKVKKGETFGWDVFNEDSLFNAYKKRLKAMPHYKEIYEAQKDNPDMDIEPSEEKKQKLVEDLQAQQENREKFSRRRKFYEDEDIDYINDRNRVYNKKLERAFGKYAADIKLNLERGTALNE